LFEDVFDVGETPAYRVLDTPCPPSGRPLDLTPQFTVDGKMIGLGVGALGLDHAVASAVCHFVLSFL
jgi:hypothetical protein